MEHKQQTQDQIRDEKRQGERAGERHEPRRLRIEALEERTAPSALWTD